MERGLHNYNCHLGTHHNSPSKETRGHQWIRGDAWSSSHFGGPHTATLKDKQEAQSHSGAWACDCNQASKYKVYILPTALQSVCTIHLGILVHGTRREPS